MITRVRFAFKHARLVFLRMGRRKKHPSEVILPLSCSTDSAVLCADTEKSVETVIRFYPGLKRLKIVADEYDTNLIKSRLSTVKRICGEKNIPVDFWISVSDADETRNFPGNPESILDTVLSVVGDIRSDLEKYCDSIGVLFLITKHNVYRLEEVEIWSKRNNIPVVYDIAASDLQFNNPDTEDPSSLFSDQKALLMAGEFFYKKAVQNQSESYFGKFLYLRDKERHAYCKCLKNELADTTTHCKVNSSALRELSGTDPERNGTRGAAADEGKNTSGCRHCSRHIELLDAYGLKTFRKDILKNSKILF